MHFSGFPLLLFLAVFMGSVLDTKAQQQPKTDARLQKALLELTRDFKGVVGIYVYNLKTNRVAALNADTLFPTASIIKVPILAAVFKKISEGKYAYHEPLLYREDRSYGGSGLMQFFKDSTGTDLRTALGLMIAYSDNTTALWSQELAGGGGEINALMENLGLPNTRVNSRTEGREENKEKYGWGQTTPREMATLLLKMRKGELINKAASEEMYRLMTNSVYTDYALSQIPPYVQAASKQGMVDDSRSELLLVNAPNGEYVFYFTTKEIEDQSWTYSNEAWELSRKVSAYLWNYFEPGSGWKPAEGTRELTTGPGN